MNMKEKYVVENYHSFINLPTEDNRHPVTLEAGKFNSLEPYTKKLTLEQIEYINQKCNVIKIGRIQFQKEDEAELFEYLDIRENEDNNIFRAEDIQDIIKNPTKEKLMKIISIKDLATIDLFRGLVVSYGNLGSNDVSTRVVNLVNNRRNEIYKNPLAQSKLTAKKTEEEKRAEQMEVANNLAIEKLAKELSDKYESKIADLEKKLKAKDTRVKRDSKPKQTENNDK